MYRIYIHMYKILKSGYSGILLLVFYKNNILLLTFYKYKIFYY